MFFNHSLMTKKIWVSLVPCQLCASRIWMGTTTSLVPNLMVRKASGKKSRLVKCSFQVECNVLFINYVICLPFTKYITVFSRWFQFVYFQSCLRGVNREGSACVGKPCPIRLQSQRAETCLCKAEGLHMAKNMFSPTWLI